jgi:arsenite/tail-anchored protein-transporting ATPase
VSAFAALLETLPRTSLVVGKGGVGKTTCAVGIATLFARRGERTLILSTDPAAALAEVAGAPVSFDAAPLAGEPNLDARQLSAAQLRQSFLGEWRETIAEIIDRGTYLDRADVDGVVDAALPGVDEIFALLALAEVLSDSSEYTRVVVDTAPTGHTLRLLEMPETFRSMLSMLDLMQDKHRFMVRALTHRYRRDRADDFLDTMRARIDGLRAALTDTRAVAAILITRDEPVVEAESRRYLESLRTLRVHVAAVFVNATFVDATSENNTPRSTAYASGVPTYMIPNAAPPPRGLNGVAAIVNSAVQYPHAAAGRARSTPPRSRRSPSREPQAAKTISPSTELTIVAGKGGVGKSTVACALAIAVADAYSGVTLLVSTDPAPSIADALGASKAPWARTDAEHALVDPPRLVVRQMDATAAFARLREEYQGRIDALFDTLVGRGVDVERDHAILRDLLALAPPGVDEVFALSILGDALDEKRFARIIVDPAPTGHLLRLLEMPAIALDWTHRLMRLMLKYRDVVGLGDSARELLDFAKRTRALDTLLHDRERCSLVLVSLDEPVVRAETERLAAALHARSIDVAGLVWNRARRDPSPLPASVSERQYCAREVSPPPIGATALRDWSKSWHELSVNS